MQPVDLTTLTAACSELRATWLPARVEQVYQRDRHTVHLALRTLEKRGWLTLSWHPQAARIHIGEPPPRTPDTFTFSDQLRHQLNGLAWVAIAPLDPWERALDLQFARRPGEPVLWHLYVEIMGKRSNAILTDRDDRIVTAAHQVSEKQSSLRPILTGQPYEVPPALDDPIPSLAESRDRWQERVGLIPGPIARQLLKSYRGLSSRLTRTMAIAAGIDPQQSSDRLDEVAWGRLFDRWQDWLKGLEACRQGDLSYLDPRSPGKGYTVLKWDRVEPETEGETAPSVQVLLDRYYGETLARQSFEQLHHQLSQKVAQVLLKVNAKERGFRDRLGESEAADEYRQKADLLMASLHRWQPGMQTITLDDFATGNPVKIVLNPEKNAVQNAQALYKQHQKLKRAKQAVEPLLAQVVAERNYLEQVEVAISQVEDYRDPSDLETLEDIREELVQQGYLAAGDRRSRDRSPDADFYRYTSPNGFELVVGRNNRQNDLLSFRIAGDYDLWFHTQEIPGSHALLRLKPGAVADEADLQFAADWAAYYSRARQSDAVPVVYTEPKYVYKPKGAQPGMAIYKHERVIWGRPQRRSGHG
ncbi:NFACT family protein [Oxynema sp. CENA135]|uniref:Rqc2 family fibronectin-binding protein n=1 Tax=Oxynema sp. CENA135 TaxID=984206 RepID=UPI00190A0C58|nr:NFACT RNA binding domain-containing protein [Oxynema sp. CENA135]MBK4732683.1 NFACT family protein [Oxynema sp. CENA135]